MCSSDLVFILEHHVIAILAPGCILPFQGWHGVFLQSKNFKLRTKRTHCCGKQCRRIYICLFCAAKMLVGECPKPLCSALFQCRLRVPAGRFLPCDALRVIEDLHEVRCGFCQRCILHLFRDRCIQKRNAPFAIRFFNKSTN